MGLKFEWAWQNPKKSRIFRKGLGGGTGSSRALAGSLQKMGERGGPLGKLRLLMILLCKSEDFREEMLNVYFFEEQFKFDFEDLLDVCGANDSFHSDCCDGDMEKAESSASRIVLPPQMKVYLMDRVEDMPFFRLSDSQKQRDLMPSGKIENGDDSDDDGIINNEDMEGNYFGTTTCSYYDKVDEIQEIDSNDSMGGDMDEDDSRHENVVTTTLPNRSQHLDSSRENSPSRESTSSLENSISTSLCLTDRVTQSSSEYYMSRSNKIQPKQSDGRNYHYDSTVIDLLDGSDDDDDDNEKEPSTNETLRDISLQSSCCEIMDMDLCSPGKRAMDLNSSLSFIDLTASSPTPKKVIMLSHSSMAAKSVDPFLGDERVTSDTIDLCSP